MRPIPRREAAALLRFLAHPVRSFHPASMPIPARRNYRRELTYTVLFSVVLAIVEGSIVSFIVRRAFEGVVPTPRLNLVVGFIIAAPELANITSFFWAALAQGRHKVLFINVLQLVMIGLVAVIALAPRTEGGLYLLVGAMFMARVFMSGVITLRSTVWRANYPRTTRARVTGKLAAIQVLIVAGVGYGLGHAMDWRDDALRLLLPVAALLGIVGVGAFGRVRVRRHALLLRHERNGAREDRPSLHPGSVLRLLRQDRHYAGFLGSLFVLGVGNMMLTAPLVIVLREQFRMDYSGGILVVSTVPLLVMPFFIPLWARLLDRSHVVRFRSLHSWVFVLAQGVVLLGVQTHQTWLLYAGMFVQGIGYGGGTLAWNLGHLDFAPPALTSHYMGAHLTLNGLRGLVAPVLAVQAYAWLDGLRPGAGNWVFALSILLCAGGAVGFGVLLRAMGERGRHAPREG